MYFSKTPDCLASSAAAGKFQRERERGLRTGGKSRRKGGRDFVWWVRRRREGELCRMGGAFNILKVVDVGREKNDSFMPLNFSTVTFMLIHVMQRPKQNCAFSYPLGIVDTKKGAGEQRCFDKTQTPLMTLPSNPAVSKQHQHLCHSSIDSPGIDL